MAARIFRPKISHFRKFCFGDKFLSFGDISVSFGGIFLFKFRKWFKYGLGASALSGRVGLTCVKKEQIMIEDRSYGKAELAMLYFPTATPRVALNRLVRWINRCPELKQSLCSGYAGKFSHFYTRQQVAEIIEFLDEP